MAAVVVVALRYSLKYIKMSTVCVAAAVVVVVAQKKSVHVLKKSFMTFMIQTRAGEHGR